MLVKVLALGLSMMSAVVLAQMPPGLPGPPPAPYNMFGPINPYPSSSSTSITYPPQQAQMPPPPSGPMYPPSMPPPIPYGGSSSYPMMAAAAAPYPVYGQPPSVMYPPPYQTFSGAGGMGDPFSSGPTGICKVMTSQFESPFGPVMSGFFKKMNMGMMCSRYSR